MDIGIQLTGNLPSDPSTSAQALVERIAAWLERTCAPPMLLDRQIEPSSDGWPAVYAAFHHLAPWVEFAVAPPRVRVTTLTSCLGPGYHQYVCGLAKQLAQELHITWDRPGGPGSLGDPTGYFYTGDRAALERTMLAWLRVRLFATLLAGFADGTAVSLLVPSGRPRFVLDPDGLVTTPMGPRDLSWARAICCGTAGSDKTAGSDAFPWWKPGEAEGLRGRVISAMWLDVRWTQPANQGEEDFLAQIEAWAAEAARRDPTIELPLGELGLLRGPPVIERCRTPSAPAPRIGYRNGLIHLKAQSFWTLRLPGCLAFAEDDTRFCAWDLKRSLDLRYFGFKQDLFGTLAWLDAPSQGYPVYTFARPNVAGRAVVDWIEGTDGNPRVRMVGFSAAARNTVMSTFVLDDLDQVEWALAAWQSLEPPAHFANLYAAALLPLGGERPLSCTRPGQSQGDGSRVLLNIVKQGAAGARAAGGRAAGSRAAGSKKARRRGKSPR